ncbi:MAG: NADH-quinone oxidoreductase subunit N, partial [Ktedonobacterales bacterium]|nr:NADH-quinone oxidoreductase subunit N [Ktedonobacterales bacterium]
MEELQWTLRIIPELVLGGLVLVLLPLGVSLPARHQRIATWVALIGLIAAGATTARMLTQPMGPVFGATYAVDPFAIYFKLFAIASTGLVLLATAGHFRGRPLEGAVPAMLVLTCLGISGLAASQDLALITLFIQIVTVGSYVLVGLAKNERLATEGALKLFLFSATASAVMIYGMTFLFGLTGTLRLPELAAKLPAAPALVVLVALCFVLVGYGYEITLAPFHFWAPDTYQGAPTPVTAFLSVASKLAGFVVILRVFGVALQPLDAYWPQIFAVLAVITMTVGNVAALRQTNIKRMMGYSSIGQAGYALTALAAATRTTTTGLIFFLIAYAITNLGVFVAIIYFSNRLGTDELADYNGLSKRSPIMALALTVCLLSLVGMPPMVGFWSKVYLFLS